MIFLHRFSILFNLKLFQDFCKGKPCGELCRTQFLGNPINGTCDGKGSCADPWDDACGAFACLGKSCGDDCWSGNVEGWCDTNGHCNVANENSDCEGLKI